MSPKHAYRDLKICSKDCLCLFVCPTGAADNETGQIDFEKCIGCGACAEACPSKAISMLPRKYPPQQKKNEEVLGALSKVVCSKVEEVRMFHYLLEHATTDEEKKLWKALIHSNQVVVEDLMRESGYMLPQSSNTRQFLQNIRSYVPESLQKKVNQLLEKLVVND